jgi:hypothetical protein
MLTKASPLLGYNNNVRHGGRVFHIQTEDSGVRYGHVISHVFADGGRILKSLKTSYAKYVGDDRMVEIVREMMRQQHKAMFMALRDGLFDSLVDGSSAVASCPPSVATATRPSLPISNAPAECAVTEPPPSAYRVVGPALPALGESASTGSEGNASARPRPRLGDPDAAMADGIERSVERLATSSWLAEDVPPPPPCLSRNGAGEMAIGPPVPSPEPCRKPQEGTLKGATVSVALAVRPAGEPRYASTRPASIFGRPRPPTESSLFGADVARDKLLDEVILNFLAADDSLPSK